MSGEGLTADNRSFILDAVLIMVHIGVAALVKELLVAAVMGMAAPRGAGRGEQARIARLGHLLPAETLIICPISSLVRPSEQGGYFPEVTQPGKAGQCPRFLSMIMFLCAQGSSFPPLEPWLQLLEGPGGPAMRSGGRVG